jgi:hypothetical protein
MQADHTRHLTALSDRIEADERIQELRAKMAFLVTPGIDHNTISSLCADTPFMASQTGSELAMKSFKRACLRFYDEKIRHLSRELAHLC